MKNRYLRFIIVVTIFASCKKDSIINTPDRVGISKVTYFPIITISGDENLSVVQGSAFTDPGVKASVGGSEVNVTTTGTVNTAEAGLYVLNYTATNTDGFSASSSRNVFVIPSQELPGVDLSGEYMTTGGTPDATITKIAAGVYYTTNCWGNGSAAIIPAYFFCIDGKTVSIPLQNGSAGHIRTTGPGTYEAGLITWEVVREDFPDGPLVRVKTWQKL